MSWKDPIKPKIPSFDEVMAEEPAIPSFSEVMGNEKKNIGGNGLPQNADTIVEKPVAGTSQSQDEKRYDELWNKDMVTTGLHGSEIEEYAQLSKKLGRKNTNLYDENNQLKQSITTTSQSIADISGVSLFDNPKLNPLSFKTDVNTPNVINTPDGVQFELNNPTPLGNTPQDIQALQQRVYNKTATDQDAQVLAQSSGKSLAATQAYLREDKNKGNAIEANEDFEKTTALTIEGINQVGNLVGLHFDPNEILSSPNKSAQLLQAIKQVEKDEIAKNTQAKEYRKAVIAAPTYTERKIPGEVPDIDPERLKQSNELQNALTSNITKLTADEAIKNGLSDDQRNDLLYQRLDPVGYAQNQKLRQPRQTTSNMGADAIYKVADFVMGSEEKNKEALNAEKSKYALLANKGLRDLAIEKKAKGIATNDQALIEEANLIIPKIKEDSEIIESSPMLMKQQMANYINQRFAEEAGLLEGTEAKDFSGRLKNAFGIMQTAARRYLKEGGFYENPAYKDYADDVADHPNTYLADNSAFGRLGSSFLKPFVSVFNTVGDLTGIRTKADIHAENIREQMFPEQLTEGIKPDVSFSVGGHAFNLNVNNTINSVANLGGYAAIAATTGGIASGVGLSASAAARAGAWASFGMDAVDSGLKDSDKMGLTPAQSWLFAGMKAVMFAEGGRLLELGKSAIPTIKGVNEGLAKAVIGISDKSLSEKAAKEAVDGVANAWGEGLLKYGLSTAKGAGVMAGFGVGDSMLKVAYGDENTDPNEILPEAANAYLQGLFTMGLFGAPGIKGEVNHAKNSTYKGMLSKIVDNHDAAADILKIGLDKGTFTPEEFDQKMQILNTGIQSKATLNLALEKSGVNLTPEQKAVWVANATAEKSLRNQSETPDISEADAKKYSKVADSFKEQNTQVLDGLTFNKFLEPETQLYNAKKEHKEALAEFAANPTPENEKAVLNKKEAIDKILFSPKTDTNVKAEETQKAEVLKEETAPSIEKLKEVKLEVFDENGEKQKYKDIEFIDPVFNKTRTLSAQKAKLELENRHDILYKLIKCLT